MKFVAALLLVGLLVAAEAEGQQNIADRATRAT
jgi:hypothetical protein